LQPTELQFCHALLTIPSVRLHDTARFVEGGHHDDEIRIPNPTGKLREMGGVGRVVVFEVNEGQLVAAKIGEIRIESMMPSLVDGSLR